MIGYFVLSFSKSRSARRRQNIKKMIKAKTEFAEIRKMIREMSEVNDLEDQIAAHFLKLNGDIQTLNYNQDKVIDYIHKNFNATSIESPDSDQSIEEIDSDSQLIESSSNFVSMFTSKLKQKVA